MRIFVTGVSGFIGAAVARELTGAGHEVVGLARSEESAAAVAATGIEVYRGDIDDPASLVEAAVGADGTIHLAYNHAFTDMAAAARTDLGVVETIGAALAGSDKAFVITSGTLGLALASSEPPPRGVATEELQPEAGIPRIASELAILDLAHQGVRSSLVRLSPSVHGETDHGFVPRLIDIARDHGFSAYVGDGSNRWPAVHRLDAAVLYRLAVESAPAGSRLHGVADQGVPFQDIAAVIGAKLDLPVRSIAPEEATDHFGFLGMLVQVDNPTSSALTQERLGWTPVHPGLIDDLEAGHYFGV